jgi:hypothetical protein
MLITYVQHESLKQVTLFFDQATLVAWTWPQIVNNLIDLTSKYNVVENMLEDNNNQL